VHTANREFPIPSVIRLPYLVKRPFRVVRKLTRVEVFNRDGRTCQYCGRQTRQLTLDHVIPRFRGGQHTWENVVSACVACNRKKAGRTPEEAGMKLRRTPTTPHINRYSYIPVQYLQARHEWERYFPR
jgi:5-methylcytosine-specific restriction endonuclease McrA